MKKILITGGAGFIGSNMCRFFLDRGYFVRSLDNFSTGHKENIKDLLDNKNFQFLEGDIRDFELCNKSCKNIDFVSHQAALGSIPRSIKDPILTHQVNVNGFLNIILASNINKVKKFIYASSSSVYGDSEKLPKIENNIGNPLSPYAITKKSNEDYARVFSSIYNLKTFGLRYFNVFGPYQDPNGAYAAVVPKFINSFINNQSPVINGDGSFTRDFTYIDNILHMNYLLIKNDFKELNHEVFNVACGSKTSILRLSKLIKSNLSLLNKNIKEINIKYKEVRKGDIPHSLASIEKANKLINYYPKTSFEEGLDKTIKWFYEKNTNK